MDIEILKEKATNWDNYQRKLEELKNDKNKAIKKTLTIPKWLDELATEQSVNFSQTLQDALKEKLGIK
jgi:hypothetical protein